VVPDRGPVGGLLTALHDLGDDEWLLLSACDWVGIESDWLHALLDRQLEATHVILFETDRYEPLLSLYHRSVRSAVRERIDAGDLAMHRLLSRLDVTAVAAPPGWDQVTNLNRPPGF
jgi:molybdopterin-guanine dinucleotide biosynthesis protein A